MTYKLINCLYKVMVLKAGTLIIKQSQQLNSGISLLNEGTLRIVFSQRKKIELLSRFKHL